MVRIRADVRVDLSRMQRYAGALRSGRPPLQRVLSLWQKRYNTFLSRRFARSSMGGGDWAGLAPSTVKAKGSPIPILVDTGVLMRAFRIRILRPPTKIGPLAIRVGFPKSMKRRHPGKPGRKKRTSKTIQQIAMFHQLGTARMPARKLIVDPPIGVRRGFVTDMKTVMGDLKRWAKV